MVLPRSVRTLKESVGDCVRGGGRMAFFLPPFLSLDPLYSSSVPVVEPATVGVLFFVFEELFLNREKDGMVKKR